MNSEITKPIDIAGILFMYFGFYLVMSNIGMMFLMTAFYIFINPEYFEFIYVFQFIIDIITMISIVTFSRRSIKDGFKKGINSDFFLNTLKFYAIFWITNIAVSLPISLMTGGEVSENQQAIEMMTGELPVYMFFSVVIFAPIVEELVFRVGVYGGMRKKFSVPVSVLVSALSFAMMHVIISLLSGNFADLIFVVAYAVPGAILCLAYEKTDNILVPITVHWINNLIAIFAILLV